MEENNEIQESGGHLQQLWRKAAPGWPEIPLGAGGSICLSELTEVLLSECWLSMSVITTPMMMIVGLG